MPVEEDDDDCCVIDLNVCVDDTDEQQCPNQNEDNIIYKDTLQIIL